MKYFKKIKDWSNSWVGSITIVLFIMFFVTKHFNIPSGSMKDTLLVGDHVFSKNFAYGLTTPYLPFVEINLMPWTDGHLIDGPKPQRGDIVIFRYPNNKKLHYVKRCVGTEGDLIFLKNKTLFIHFNEGDEYIKNNYDTNNTIKLFNKLWVKNPYSKEFKGIHNDENVIEKNNPHRQIFQMSIIEVPKNEYFMMGDNRDHSNDSRFWGTVPYSLIVGKPWFVLFSMGDWFEFKFDRFLKSVDDLQYGQPLENSIEYRKSHGITFTKEDIKLNQK